MVFTAKLLASRIFMGPGSGGFESVAFQDAKVTILVFLFWLVRF